MEQIIVFNRRVDKGARPGQTAYPTVHMGWRVGDIMEAQEGVLKTGTSTVGITFNGGVVVGADHLSRTLAAEVALFQLRRGQNMTVKGAATFTANILSGRPHWVQLLIVGVDDDGSHVYSIDSAGGSIPDVYCATGSGSPYMYGVLEDGFSEGMSRKDAVALAARALNASGQRDAASGNGMDLAVITAKDGFVLVEQSEIDAILKKK